MVRSLIGPLQQRHGALQGVGDFHYMRGTYGDLSVHGRLRHGFARVVQSAPLSRRRQTLNPRLTANVAGRSRQTRVLCIETGTAGDLPGVRGRKSGVAWLWHGDCRRGPGPGRPMGRTPAPACAAFASRSDNDRYWCDAASLAAAILGIQVKARHEAGFLQHALSCPRHCTGPNVTMRHGYMDMMVALPRWSTMAGTRMLAPVIVVLLLLAGCAAPPVLGPAQVGDYRARAWTQEDGGVRVSTSVLSAEESVEVYGFRLAKKGIQPVWVEVANTDDRDYFLLFPGLDPGFFLPSEAADLFSPDDSPDDPESPVRGRFRDFAFRNPIPAGATVAGFVLTNLDQGVKAVQIDLWATDHVKSFSFLVNVPGLVADYDARGAFTRKPYESKEILRYEELADFRAALEALPCCVTNKAGTRDGDPINLVIVGNLRDAFPALIRRGWAPTEVTWSGSVIRMVKSALAKDRYPYAPVSPLWLYGRPQDLALQRARDNIHQRNHMRLWRAPMLLVGRPVWVGQISRDIGSRLTIHSKTLTTHKIDPDVDDARSALVEDMAYSQNLAAFGLVCGVGAATEDAPRRNLTTDPYFTDGYRAVLIFDEELRSLDEIQFLPWESPLGPPCGARLAEENP